MLLVLNAEALERLDGMRHGVPIGGGTHDHGNRSLISHKSNTKTANEHEDSFCFVSPVASCLSGLLALTERVATFSVEVVEPFGLHNIEPGARDAILQSDGLRMRHGLSVARAEKPAIPQIRIHKARELTGKHFHAAIGNRLKLEISGKPFELRPKLAGRTAGPIQKHVEAHVIFFRLSARRRLVRR